jgi:hypothetical protein
MAFRVVQGCRLVQRRDGNGAGSGVQYRLSVLDLRYMHCRCTFNKRCVSCSSGHRLPSKLPVPAVLSTCGRVLQSHGRSISRPVDYFDRLID